MAGTKKLGLPWWFYALFIGIGVILLGVGGWWTVRVNKFLATAVESPGQIVDFQSYRDDDGQTMYQPVISFTAQDGSSYEVVGGTASSWKPDVGKQVSVLYDPANPDAADLKGFWSQWMGPVIFLGIGGMFLLISLLLLVLTRGKPVVSTSSNVDFMLDD